MSAKVSRHKVRSVAKEFGLDPDIFERQIEQESGRQKHVGSPAGAQGPAQLMPGTARSLGVNINDPIDNLRGGAKYMRQMLKLAHGDYAKALWAYNAGPGNMQKGIKPAETEQYLRIILGGHSPKASMGANARGGQTDVSDRMAQAQAMLNADTGMTIPGSSEGTSALAQLDTLRRFQHAGAHGDPLELAAAFNPDQPSGDFTVGGPGDVQLPAGASSHAAARARKGKVPGYTITGPEPGRIKPLVTHFLDELSSVAGEKIVGSDGTGHSKYTVNGNVSEHFTGHATDIPARGAKLTKLGQAALIAAGWSPKKAHATHGGLFNVEKDGVRYQIIFNTHEGGDHTDHLHVGASHR